MPNRSQLVALHRDARLQIEYKIKEEIGASVFKAGVSHGAPAPEIAERGLGKVHVWTNLQFCPLLIDGPWIVSHSHYAIGVRDGPILKWDFWNVSNPDVALRLFRHLSKNRTSFEPTLDEEPAHCPLHVWKPIVRASKRVDISLKVRGAIRKVYDGRLGDRYIFRTTAFVRGLTLDRKTLEMNKNEWADQAVNIPRMMDTDYSVPSRDRAQIEALIDSAIREEYGAAS